MSALDPGPDTAPETCRCSVCVCGAGEEVERELSSRSPRCTGLLDPCLMRLCVHVRTCVRACVSMHAQSCVSEWKCVSVPGSVWVYVLHMGLACVHLHVCLSLCA